MIPQDRIKPTVEEAIERIAVALESIARGSSGTALDDSRDLRDSSRVELLSRTDVADLFEITTRTVSRWIAEGRIPRPMKLGRRPRWRRSTIERLLDRRPK